MIIKLHEILPEEMAALKLEATKDKNKNVIGKLRYNFIVGDKENLNKRTYPGELVKREIQNMMNQLGTQKIASTLDHPQTIAPELQKVSHIITKVEYDEENKIGVAESSILQTTAGKNLKVLIDNGVKLGASIRGTGSVDSLGMVQADWKLNGIDLVSNPSFGETVGINTANLIESGNQVLQQVMTEDEKLFSKWDFALSAGAKLSFDEYKEKLKEQENK